MLPFYKLKALRFQTGGRTRTKKPRSPVGGTYTDELHYKSDTGEHHYNITGLIKMELHYTQTSYDVLDME